MKKRRMVTERPCAVFSCICRTLYSPLDLCRVLGDLYPLDELCGNDLLFFKAQFGKKELTAPFVGIDPSHNVYKVRHVRPRLSHLVRGGHGAVDADGPTGDHAVRGRDDEHHGASILVRRLVGRLINTPRTPARAPAAPAGPFCGSRDGAPRKTVLGRRAAPRRSTRRSPRGSPAPAASLPLPRRSHP